MGIFINDSSINGLYSGMTSGVTGDSLLTIILIIIIFLILGIILRFALEAIIILLIPMILVIMKYNPAFIPIGSLALLILGFILFKSFFFR